MSQNKKTASRAVNAKAAPNRSTKAKSSTKPAGGEAADEGRLQHAMAYAVPTLSEILKSLENGNREEAEIDSQVLLKGLSEYYGPEIQVKLYPLINAWISSNANGQSDNLRLLLGVQPEEKSSQERAADMREKLVDENLKRALLATGTERDELILSAVKVLAQLPVLSRNRCRTWFADVGLSEADVDELEAQERRKLDEAKDTLDPIRELIGKAVTANDAEREAALRLLFTALSKLGPYTLPTYQAEAQERLRLTGAEFSKMLAAALKHTSSANVIDGQLCWNGEAYGNFSAKITHELTKVDGQSAPVVVFSIASQLDTGETLGTAEVLAEEFPKMSWLNGLGARVVTFKAPSNNFVLARAIKELSREDLKREKVYTYTGWATIDGKPSFLTTSGAITGDGLNTAVRVDLGAGPMKNYALPDPPQDPREAVRASLAFLDLANLKATAALWAAQYAAPLTPVHQLRGTLWVYGQTQSRKTTLTMLALAHFGKGFIRGRQTHPPQNWKTTRTEIEGSMFMAKDLPMVIDNYTPQFASGADAKYMLSLASYVIQSVGDNNSRGRAQADLTSRPQRPPRGLVIATAEEPLTGQATEGRMIYVPISPGDVHTEGSPSPLDAAQETAGGRGLYAQAMAAYVRWLAQDWGKRAALAESLYEYGLKEGKKRIPDIYQGRLVDYFALLCMGARMVLNFALEVEAISEKRFAELSKSITAELLDLLAEQSARISNQAPIKKVCEALSSGLAWTTQNHLTMIPLLESKSAIPDRCSLIGWYEKSSPVIYLDTASCLQVAREFWGKLGQNFDVQPDSFRRDMCNAGILVKREDRQYEIKKWMGSDFGNVRVLAIDANKLEAATGFQLYPPKIDENREIPENESPP